MTTKKYISLEKLGLYDEKIKAKIAADDAATLASAKSYAEGLGVNYDAAGAAATVQGKLDEEIARAKAAEEANATAAKQAQDEVDALEVLVGALPEGTTATTVVDYVNKKTEGIATDAALGELNSQVAGLQTAVQGIQADYLVEADKTELSGAIDAEKTRAEGIEGGLRTDVDAIKADYLKAADKEALQGAINGVAEDVATISGDYLKGADKTELEGKIGAKADQTALDAEVEAREGAIEGLQTQINTIMNNPDAEGAINSINEFTQYVTEHGTIADGFRTDIDKNKTDIVAMDTAYKAADTAIQGRLDALEGIDHEAYVAADTALENKLNGEIAKKADASSLTAAVEALEGADTTMQGRLDALEAKFGDGEGNVESQITTAKQEAIDSAVGTAAADATSKANAAEAAAKAHADSLNTAMDARMVAVEGKAHEHANKELLDSYTQTEANLADAVAKKHEHANKAVLDGVTAEKVAAWDKVSEKADLTALQDEIDRAKAAEQANADAIAAFVEASEEEINAMFA